MTLLLKLDLHYLFFVFNLLKSPSLTKFNPSHLQQTSSVHGLFWLNSVSQFIFHKDLDSYFGKTASFRNKNSGEIYCSPSAQSPISFFFPQSNMWGITEWHIAPGCQICDSSSIQCYIQRQSETQLQASFKLRAAARSSALWVSKIQQQRNASWQCRITKNNYKTASASR